MLYSHGYVTADITGIERCNMTSVDDTTRDEDTCATMNQCTGSAAHREATALQHHLDISTISQHIFIIELFWYSLCSTVGVTGIR